MLFLSFIFYKKKYDLDVRYDNISIYKYPIKLKYYKDSLKELSTVKKIVIFSFLLALTVIFDAYVKIPSGFGSLYITFSFLFTATQAMLFGFFPSILHGFLADNLSFLLAPSGIYMPLYTISAILTSVIYSLFFYKTKINFFKCLFSKVIVNLFINVILGSIFWYYITYWNVNKIPKRPLYLYMLTISLPKNLIFLLPQAIILYIFLKQIHKVFITVGVLPKELDKIISFY